MGSRSPMYQSLVLAALLAAALAVAACGSPASPAPLAPTATTASAATAVPPAQAPTPEPTPESAPELSLVITSPEGETFIPRQARMYEAAVSGNENLGDIPWMGACRWSFYLDQANGEELYRTMENRAVVGPESTTVCGFTDTFIDAPGVLRVVLEVDFTNPAGAPLGSASAERIYRVQ